MITRYMARYMNGMRRIFLVMISFGLGMGLVFPLIVGPFVTWNPGMKVYFSLACLGAGFAVGSFCYYLVKVTLFQTNTLLEKRKNELEAAKDRFSALTASAIGNRDWDVSFHDTHVPTCWQVKGCGKDDCPCYGKEGVRCWLVTGTYCGGKVQGRFAQKLDSCSQCEVYQAAVECDPISEIGENFNSLMWVVKERETELSMARAELQEQYEELERLHHITEEAAITDALTGLKNHGHFQERLEEELVRAGRYGRPLSLVMIDLDFFKSINDKFGHQKGDAVLAGLGAFLRRELRQVDYAARYGGEEFVIIMPETDGPAARKVAERLRENVKCIAGEAGLSDAYIAASFGVADYPACAPDAPSLIAAADSALLFSKSKGRNRVSYFRDLSETELKEGDLDSLNSRLEHASLKTICSLAEAVDARDQYSGGEARQLARVADAMAESLGLEKRQADALALATVLHDIGKIGVPDEVLNKREKLSNEEIEMIRQHPDIGRRIIQEAEQIQDLVSAILYHHERWDGQGYPEQLKGEQIPLMARIIGIFDAYRAMMSDRPYRKAMSEAEAIAELRKGAGSQFDPELVELFIGIVSQGGGEAVAQAG